LRRSKRIARNEQRLAAFARFVLEVSLLPSIVHICEETGTTVILDQPSRDKMECNALLVRRKISRWKSIKFYSSIRIKVARRAWIEIPNKNPAVSSDNEKVGIIMKAKIQKSKVSNPFGEAELPFFFDRGFVSYDDIMPIRKELIKTRKEQFNV
jgi:RecA/RadA recombinase